jgi:hypothetical protein
MISDGPGRGHFFHRLGTAVLIAAPIGIGAAGPLDAQVTGVVVDAADGRPLDGARVVVLSEAMRALAAGHSEADGRFRIEVDPALEGLRVVATRVGYRANAPLAWTADAAGEMRVALTRLDPSEMLVPLPESTRRGRVLGRVADPAGAPLAAVLVTVAGDSVLSNDRGYFEVAVEGEGPIPVRFEALGRATVVDTVRTQAEEGVFLTVVLPVEAIELDPITVTAVSRRTMLRLEDLRRRVAMGFGDFVTRQEFAARGYPTWRQFLEGMPGMRIAGGVPVFRRSASLSGPCPPTFYMDGVKLRSWTGTTDLSTMDLELVELYSGAAATPPEYVDSDSGCGVVVLWTRRGIDLPYADLVDWRTGG